MKLSAPVLLTDEHNLDSFESGVTSLDDWLKRRARPNQVSGASRTYVVATEDRRVVGYYALASGGVAAGEDPYLFDGVRAKAGQRSPCDNPARPSGGSLDGVDPYERVNRVSTIVTSG